MRIEGMQAGMELESFEGHAFEIKVHECERNIPSPDTEQIINKTHYPTKPMNRHAGLQNG